MATDKKHIAVYLDPAVEKALIAFCEQQGLISKKGTMFSAGVNVALAEFFGTTDTDVNNTPTDFSNIPDTGNIPNKSEGNILSSTGNIPHEIIGVEVLLGKTPSLSDSEVESLQAELKTLERDFDTCAKWRRELDAENKTLKLQLEVERADREEIEHQLSELKQNPAPVATLSQKLKPDAATILSQLRAKRKKSKTDLADVEAILEILEN